MGDLCFSWNQKNDAQRNMLSMVKQAGSNPDIVKWCEDLAKRGYLSDDFSPDDPARPYRKGGSNNANQRERPPKKKWVVTAGGSGWVANPNAWQQQPPGGSGGSSGSSGNRTWEE